MAAYIRKASQQGCLVVRLRLTSYTPLLPFGLRFYAAVITSKCEAVSSKDVVRIIRGQE